MLVKTLTVTRVISEINNADNSNLQDSYISFENEIRENNALSIHRRSKRLTFEQQIAIAATASVAGVIVTFTGCFPAVVVCENFIHARV